MASANARALSVLKIIMGIVFRNFGTKTVPKAKSRTKLEDLTVIFKDVAG